MAILFFLGGGGGGLIFKLVQSIRRRYIIGTSCNSVCLSLDLHTCSYPHFFFFFFGAAHCLDFFFYKDYFDT